MRAQTWGCSNLWHSPDHTDLLRLLDCCRPSSLYGGRPFQTGSQQHRHLFGPAAKLSLQTLALATTEHEPTHRVLVALTIMRVDTMSTSVTLFFSTMLVTMTSDMLRAAEMMVPAGEVRGQG